MNKFILGKDGHLSLNSDYKEGAKTMLENKKVDFIYKWIKDCVEGPGGLFDYEEHELAVRNDTDEMTGACWIIQCLANPSNKKSADVLQAIIDRRKKLS